MPEPLLDIRPDHLQIVRDILQKHVPLYEVWAFGSRAKWSAKEHSDLDLCILSDKPLSFSVLGAIEDDFSESDLPWKVDVVDWATTSETFRAIIERDKVEIQQANASAWPYVRLGHHCEKIGSGATPKGGKEAYLTSGPYRLIRSQNIYNDGFKYEGLAYISNEQAKKLDGVAVNADDVLLNITGDSVARVCSAPSNVLPARVNQHVAIIRPSPTSLDAHFVRYYLASPKQQDLLLGLASAGATRNALTKGMIEDLQVPQPPMREQKAIAATLATLDDKIDLLRETNATLEAIAQALFKSWFVNFDPVRAKAEGREPEGILPQIAALFPSEYEDSELGEIPTGWKAMPLADTCEINPTRRLTKGKTTPYLEMSALPTQGHRTDTPIPRAFSSGTKFINGDTLLARITPCLENGKTAFVDCLLDDEVGWGSTEYIVLRPKAPLPSYWAYLLSRHEHFRQYAIQAMVGTSGRQRVDVSRLAQYLVAVPDERVSVAFAELVEPLQRSIAANDDAAKSLAELRDTLLPRLMSGKLTLSKNL
jgi:type I restriction enzyme, S subunit